MTIDTLIGLLTDAREVLPAGGQAEVCLPDYQLLCDVWCDDEVGVVVLSAEALEEHVAVDIIDSTERHCRELDGEERS